MFKFFRFIKNLFTKKPVYQSHGEPGEDFKPRWGIIVPHTSTAPGAYNKNRKESEYGYGLELVGQMQYPNRTRDGIGVSGAAKLLVKNDNVNAILEPHLNAYNKQVGGFEILVLKGDYLSIKYAELIAEAFAAKYPYRKLRANKGVKIISSKDRGGRNLAAHKNAGAKIALLSEAFFLDNDHDWIPPQEMANFWKSVLV